MTERSLGTSRRVVLIHLRQHESMTMDALVEATGLSKTATRAHLVRLERDGAVVRTSLESDGPGRPPAAFCLTEHGASMFPSSDEALLSRLLGFLDKNDSGKLVTAFFEELWTERMTELLDTLGVPSLEAASLDERLVALEACLADKDFMPVIDRRPCVDGSQLVTIRECNCPYPAAARASRSPCEREIEFLVSALGARPRSLSIASNRKETCTFEFVVGPPDPSSEHQGA